MFLHLHLDAEEKFRIYLENVPAQALAVTIKTSTQIENNPTFNLHPLSPTDVLLTIQGGEGPKTLKIAWCDEYISKPFTFALVGDNQGNNDTLANIINEINQSTASFLIHLGDMVPSGAEWEYRDFIEIMSQLEIPYFAVPGNHDVRGEGLQIYQNLLAPRFYSFQLEDIHFLLLDTSLLGVDSTQREWLEEKLYGLEGKAMLFLHVPLLDPRGRSHAFLDEEEAHSILDLFPSSPTSIKGVFAGHIHMFHQEMRDGIPFVISGGGGAPLYAAKEEGGFHHYALVHVQEGALETRAYPVVTAERGTEIVITGRRKDLEVTQETLLQMVSIERKGEFQNFHGNFRGAGQYGGIPIRDLMELTGGMEEEDVLRVHSADGYRQDFSYYHVYPEELGWKEEQGEMVLAIHFNGVTLPDWTEGYRIAFLPEDGVYDNENYRKTSFEGEGWYEYPSAGSRWIKMVQRLEVLLWEEEEKKSEKEYP